MKVSLICPVYNARRTIGDVIDACLKIDFRDLELIFVDDGSTDGSAEIMSQYRVKVIRQSNGGPAKARNTGWRAASGDICFFTDSDCLPRPDVITVLVNHFGDEKVGGAGGTYEIANPQSLLARLIHAEIISRHRAMPVQVDYLGSFNCAYRKKALEEVGGFNEEFTAASAEDNDLSYRVVENGWKLTTDNSAVVGHFHETSLLRYCRQQYNHGKWRVKLYREHKNRVSGDSYASFFDLIQPPVALVILLSLPLLVLESVRGIYLLPVGFYLLLLVPRPVSIAVRTMRFENLLLLPLTFIRGFARGLGLAVGMVRFLP